METRYFITFTSEALHRNFSSHDGSSVAMVVTSDLLGFPHWTKALAEDFCSSETLIIPDSPDGWNIHAEYFEGAHRMTIYHDSVVFAKGKTLSRV